MQKIKQVGDKTFYQKRSGRYAVLAKGKGKQWVRGEDKVALLLAEGLIKPPPTKVAPAADAEPATGEETAD